MAAAVMSGGGCTIGGTTLAYESGIGGIWVGGMYAISIFLLAWLLRTKMSNMRILSTNEGVGIFYGPYARAVSALIMLIYLFMIAVLNVVSIGTVLKYSLFTTVSMIITEDGHIRIHYDRWNVGSSLHRYYTVYSNDYRCYPDSSDTRPYTRRRI